MKSKLFASLALALGVLAFSLSTHAADRFWTNSAGGDFLNLFNWSPNGVPNESDNANFNIGFFPVTWAGTRTNANAFFNSAGGGIQANMGGNSWLLTNSFVVGQNAGSTSTVLHVGGELRVTNAAGTARLVIGQNGRGAYLLQPPNASVVADQLFVTNNGAGFTNSTLLMNLGTLTTLRGSTITQAGDFAIGTVSDATATWNVLGGTNRVSLGSGSVLLGSVVGAGGELRVSGASTVWTNSADLIVGDEGDSCLLVVSNGAKAFNVGATVGKSSSASNNLAWVTGAGSVWRNSSALVVGNSGSFNQLAVSHAGTVFSLSGIIGDNSRSNAVLVAGAGSVWHNGTLDVGLDGSFNQLVVSNAGAVFNSAGNVGRFTDANGNAVFVTGAGSVWDNASDLSVGSVGSFNQLVVSNAGTVFSISATIGDLQFANSNAVFVTGAGSVWDNNTTLYVGRDGSFNQLVVSNAGAVFNSEGTIGDFPGANSNAVIVAGAGSVWSNSTSLRVGRDGSFNQLVVSNAGSVFATALTLGVGATSTNNRTVVDDGTLRVTNATQNATLNIRRGTNQLNNSALIEADVLRVTNTLGLFEFNGGMFNVRTSAVANAQPFFVGNGATPATLNLVGNGSHSFADGLTIRNNAMLIGNGTVSGVVTNQNGGTIAPGTSVGKVVLNNAPVLQGAILMEISKTGATLTNDEIQVNGTLTYGGLLTVTDIGPDVVALGDRFPLFNATSYAGSFSSVTLPLLVVGLEWTNKLLVDGSIEVVATPLGGRFWTNFAGGDFFNPFNWSPNNIPGAADNANFNIPVPGVTWAGTITNANAFFNPAGSAAVQQFIGDNSWLLTNSYVLGQNAGSTSSVIHFSGELRVTNAAGTGRLIIGQNGRGAYLFQGPNVSVVADQLFVTNNGAGFTNSTLMMNLGTLTTLRGSTITQAGNFAIGSVSNATATWNVLGGTNRVSPGSGGVLLGFGVRRHGELKVVGASTVWTNSGNLVVGDDGDSCLLLVSNGAKAFNVSATVGNNSSASNNQAWVTGAGSAWSNSASLTVGSVGSFNRLVVSNAGKVFNTEATLGRQPGSQSNVVFVTGAGSVWSNSSFMEVGGSGSFNQLIVSNGGTVLNEEVFIGGNAGANSNSVFIIGTNSRLSSASGLNVGSGGSFSQLVVSNGGSVFNAFTTIGVDGTANGNHAVVTGTNSVLSSDDLRVGGSGSFNQLVVSNGAAVFDPFAIIGNNPGANSNAVIVAGAGSVWSNGIYMAVGGSGSFNQLVVTNGGSVYNPEGTIGENPDANSNVVIVAAAGSVCRYTSGLQVGSGGSFNHLVVSNAGTVFAAGLTLGRDSSSTNNRTVVDGGTLQIRNASATAALDIRRGTNQLSHNGLVETDLLLMSSTLGFFEFNGGTLNVRASTVANAQPFFVGNGATAATLNLVGNGSHSFADGLTIRGNASLIGNGTISGVVSVQPGGSAGPGASIGRLVLNNEPDLQGALLMEISKSGSTLTNDQIQVIGTLTYDGALTVTKIGSSDLALGDRFPLFNANSYAGAFSSTNLPLLDPGLSWTNKLLVDGTIEVIVSPTGDRFWTNSAGGPYDFTANWLNGLVPGAEGNANFTNNASYQVNWTSDAAAANAFFNANSGEVTQAIGVRAWLLTNTYVVGQNPGSVATVAHASGTLRVTNSTGTAVLDVRRGTNRFHAGLIDADRLLLTNTAGRFEFNGGTLITRGGTISNDLAFNVGATGSAPAIWDARAGSDVLLTSNLVIGLNVAGCQLLMTNGGKVFNEGATIGNASSADSNYVFVVGAGSVWSNRNSLTVGRDGSFNQLIVSNGAAVFSSGGTNGNAQSAQNNLILVTGAGSIWSNRSNLVASGTFNQLVVSNGGAVFNFSASLGQGFFASNNIVLVTGTGSLWSNRSTLTVGGAGSANQLVISNAGTVFANDLTVGATTVSTNNSSIVDGGSLFVTNAFKTAVLDIKRGTKQLNNSGLIGADVLRLTNTSGGFEFNGGTLNVRTAAVANGQPFTVGNGFSAAALNLVGNGVHTFSNGLTLSANASLIGNGSITGAVSVLSGATFAPGTSVGKIFLSHSPSLDGVLLMQISKSGATLTNDQVQVGGPLNYGGTLTVNDLGPDALALGDRFPLFDASSYGGVFATVSLPLLAAGLAWTNKLLVDGSIEVVIPTPGDRFWINSGGGSYHDSANWLDNLVPIAFDNANYTNDASYEVNWTSDAAAANAFFNANSGTVTQTIGSFSWLLTNSYVVGQNVGALASVTHSSGTLLVTNSAGSGILEVRRGTNRLNAGLIDTDRLLITNTAGAFQFNGGTLITRGGSISNNLPFNVGVSGSTPAIWDARAGADVRIGADLFIGLTVSGSQLLLTNGGKLFSRSGTIGTDSTAIGSAVLVSGAGSIWNNSLNLDIGSGGSFNLLVVSNGGAVFDDFGRVGLGINSRSNSVIVVGAGSVWTNRQGISIGGSGSFNQLVISNAGLVSGAFWTLGVNGTSTNNRSVIDGGVLRVTNALHNAALDVRRGTNQLNNLGLIETDVLRMTNTLGRFEFNGGTLNVRTSTVANAQTFFVGNGVTPATLNFVGNGLHSFANELTLRANAFLTGNGSITGIVTVLSGGTFAPGTSVGKISLSNSPSLAGALVMEIRKNGATLTNDHIQVNNALTFGGTLTVTNLSPDALAAGDRFPLFNASSYGGTFSSTNLPLLAPGLAWTNKLLIDGSIEVVMTAVPSRPQFSSINLSGTILIISGTSGPANGTFTVLASTNVAFPLTSWTPVLTNQFDSSGNFVFTNAINPAMPQRFYALQVQLVATTTVFFNYGTGGTGTTTVSGVGGSVWRTKTDLTSATIGSVPATWKDEGFDDSEWFARTTQTGYGDSDENQTFIKTDYDSGTPLFTDSAPSYLFRSTFMIADVNAVASVTGEVKYDDGAIVYVNGTEILRTTNLDPAGTLANYANFNGAAATENATNTLNVPLNLLHNGANTIAVEVHQQSNASSDVTFDLKLQAN